MAPGGAESTSFTVRNAGTQVEEFRPVVAGPGWLVAAPAAMSVYPGQEATGTLQAAPPRVPGSAAGVAPFRLTVSSALHPGVAGSASGRVEVAPFLRAGGGAGAGVEQRAGGDAASSEAG